MQGTLTIRDGYLRAQPAEAGKERTAERRAEDALARLGRLFDEHHAYLYRLARRMSRDPDAARDLVQEAFLRAARRPLSVPEDASGARAWLVRVVANLCRDRWRRLRVRGGGEATLPEVVAGRRSGPDSRTVARRTVEAALQQLPPRQRAVIVLHELEGHDAGEVAEILGIARVTVRYHLHRARQELRRILRPPDELSRSPEDADDAGSAAPRDLDRGSTENEEHRP